MDADAGSRVEDVVDLVFGVGDGVDGRARIGFPDASYNLDVDVCETSKRGVSSNTQHLT